MTIIVEMDITAEDCHSNRVLAGKLLQLLDQHLALLFVLVCGVVIVQVIQQIDLTVKVVEKASCKPETFIQETERTNDGRLQDVFQPLKTRICDRHTKQQNQVLESAI